MKKNITFDDLKCSTMTKKVTIGEAADIRFGLYAQPRQFGSAGYLQLSQFNEDGSTMAEPEGYINIDKKTAPHLLTDGDVLFVGKGSRLFSTCFVESDLPAVASSVFFVLRPDKTVVDSEYLAAILNAPQSKATFRQIGGGTSIFSIRTSELAAFEIPLPPMEQQKRIAALTRLHRLDIDMMHQLIAQKQNLYTAIISKLIN